MPPALLLLQLTSSAAARAERGEAEEGTLRRAGRSLFSSLLQQSQRLLPWWSAAFCATVVFALVQVACDKRPQALAALGGERSAATGALFLRHTTQFLQDAAEEVVVLLG